MDLDFELEFSLPKPPSDDECSVNLPAVKDQDELAISPQKQQRVNYSHHRKRKRLRVLITETPDSPVAVSSRALQSNQSSEIHQEAYGAEDSYISCNDNNEGTDDHDSDMGGIDGVASPHGDFSTNVDDIQYLEYADSVLSGASAFFQLEHDLFVAEDWDRKRGDVRLGQWYHLQSGRGGSSRPVCFCPQAKLTAECFHIRFLEEYGAQQFPPDGHSQAFQNTRYRDVIIFIRDWNESISRCSFSVAAHERPDSVKSRVIVEHVKHTGVTGSWTCSKDGAGTCGHIKRARVYFGAIAKDDGLDSTGGLAGASDLPDLESVQNCLPKRPRGQTCVSYLPVLPPTWASLPSDPVLYQRSPALQRPPVLVSLNSEGQCLCGAAVKDGPVIVRQCKIYTLCEAFNCDIELQACHQSCSGTNPRYIGPDGRRQGLFNYNNRILFTHDLLDDYTMAYTSSETPFTAWVSVLDRRYKTFNPDSSFVSEDLFRNAWFNYAKLQAFTGDMQCPTCGPEPQSVIFDGVTLAYSKKHFTSTLKPPTMPHDDSVIRTCKYIKDQAFITKKDLRKQIRKIVVGRSLVLTESESRSISQPDSGRESDEEEFEVTSGDIGNVNVLKDVISRIEMIPGARLGLKSVCPDLGEIFDRYCGIGRISAGIGTPREYRIFFTEISADESALQMIPLPSLVKLEEFLKNPTYTKANLLRCIPALFGIVRYEASKVPTSETCLPELLGICKWLAGRSLEVLTALRQHRPPPVIAACEQNQPDNFSKPIWLENGSLYSMPKVRHRPRYPNLKYDQRTDGGKQRSKCSKYYAEYGENRLTGGIMVSWCTHNIAYGFHCIHKAEGRDDVFSALLTHWKTPPQWVVYDYACALGPYCMTREADFFKNTRFGIDDCHSVGHTKCSQSCFMKTYGELDPEIDRINTSAAECGNGGISRIRKSVSYMREDRAMIYTRVFLAIWNRLKIRKIINGSRGRRE